MNVISGYGPGRLMAVLLAVAGPLQVASSDSLSSVEFVSETTVLLADRVAALNPALATDPGVQAGLIDEILRPRFDLGKSSELILREYWTKASVQQQKLFVTAFYRYLVASYGDTLHWFRHDTISLLPDQAVDFGDRHRVKAVMHMHDGRSFQVQFYLRRRNDQWFVIDVIVDGISYARTYSSDFRSIIRDDGIDGLIAWLNEMAGTESVTRVPD